MRHGNTRTLKPTTDRHSAISCTRHTHLTCEIPRGGAYLSGTHCTLELMFVLALLGGEKVGWSQQEMLSRRTKSCSLFSISQAFAKDVAIFPSQPWRNVEFFKQVCNVRELWEPVVFDTEHQYNIFCYFFSNSLPHCTFRLLARVVIRWLQHRESQRIILYDIFFLLSRFSIAHFIASNGGITR